MNKLNYLFATLIFVSLLTCISISILLLNPPLRIMAKTLSEGRLDPHVCVYNAIQLIQNNSIDKAFPQLNQCKNRLAVIGAIFTDPQTLKLKSLVSNAIQSLHNSDIENFA